MSFKRATRVADLIKADIADILLREIGDPRIKSVTITGVKLTDENATGFLKRELGKRLSLRYVPDIIFACDESFAYGSKIDKLLAEIRAGEEKDIE